MMKRNGTRLCALALLACLLLTGCAQQPAQTPDDQMDLVGADWRTWGTIYDTGTITLDGEQTPVCVCVYTGEAVFYYDEPEQVEFNRAAYPESFEDAQQAIGGTSFDDQNGDGQSDVRMDFYHADGTKSTLVWYWEGQAGFVYQPDASELHVPAEG